MWLLLSFCFRTVRFKTFPDYLVVQLRKFTISEDWTPKKLGTSGRSFGNINLNYLLLKIALKSCAQRSQFQALRKYFLSTEASLPEVFLWKVVLKIYSQFTGREHPCQSAISIKLKSNFIEITLGHGCSPVNLLYFFRTPFLKNTSGRPVL